MNVHNFASNGAPIAANFEEEEGLPPQDGARVTVFDANGDVVSQPPGPSPAPQLPDDLEKRRAEAAAKLAAPKQPLAPQNVPLKDAIFDDARRFRMRCLELAVAGGATDPQAILATARDLYRFVESGL
ncbi:MAG: hypothetical protein JO107_16600 [Hyphomicrobiales bacterium]|nr:hypothetical protein [Hyphomicrobiales bacterium]MBV8664709.1 hypothetical protein [Hyphomicrobiales bacterium]